jgi:hypothetical protein
MTTALRRYGLVLLLGAAAFLFVEPVHAQGRCAGRQQSGQSSLQALAYARAQQSTLQTQPGLSPYQLQAIYGQQLNGLSQNAFVTQLLAQQYALQAQLYAYQQAALQQSYSQRQQTGAGRQATANRNRQPQLPPAAEEEDP